MRKVEPSIGPVDIVGGEEKSQLKGHLRELMGENCRNRRKVKRAGRYKERTMTVMMTMVMIFRIVSRVTCVIDTIAKKAGKDGERAMAAMRIAAWFGH